MFLFACFCLDVIRPGKKIQEWPLIAPQFNTRQSKAAFQKNIDGKSTDLFILTNKNQAEAAFTNYGARILSLPGYQTN